MKVGAQIEAILFYKARPVSVSFLAQTIGVSVDQITTGLHELGKSLVDRGLILQYHGDEVQLVTAPSASELIERMTSDEVTGDLGKASLETLTIVLYYGPVTRSQIDYIRGVNSTYSLRILLVRGLVERIDNPTDKRAHLYRATFDTLQLLGVARVTELPDYTELREAVTAFANQTSDNETTEEHLEDSTQ